MGNNILKKIDIPFQDLLNDFFARKPKDVDGVANTSTIYYRDYLLKKVLSRFEFGGIPSFWDMDYFLEILFLEGHLAITDTAMGILPFKCGCTGIGVFEQPTEVIIANPVLGSFRRTIDVDCALVKLQYNYQGIGWMINRYSALLAMCDSGIAVNLMNSKAAYVFKAGSKAQAATIQKMYDDITMGKPAVFVGENGALNSENVYTMPVKQNFVADDIQLLKRKILNEFLTEIGINNTNLDKRERLTDDEVNANNDEVSANIQHWLDNITDGLNRANKLYNLGLSVKVRDFGGGENNVEPTEPNGLLP
jgi:hypothetical protein